MKFVLLVFSLVFAVNCATILTDDEKKRKIVKQPVNNGITEETPESGNLTGPQTPQS